jgi:hypothetical protein
LIKRSSVVLAIAVALLATGFAGSATVAAAPRNAPKVVLIVGPAGAATDGYRELADQAADAALAFTPNVVKVYSPDATWPAVKRALTGASIVVYLGHGNGWPSRYRDELTRSTQDGMGLNPTAGAGDAHQYFGEEQIGKEIKLAKNAVVILNHLCYASGNSEPGLPEGTLDDGEQRVDNYAAGFILAGASAVIAEAYGRPAYYVQAILAGKGTVDRIWRTGPTFQGNLLRFDSIRSPGFVAQMDTDTPASGFHRSLVIEAGLAADRVLAGAAPDIGGRHVPAVDPTLTGLGINFARSDLAAPPTAGSSTRLVFKISPADYAALPAGFMVGVRWDRIDDPVTSEPGASGPAMPTLPTASPTAGPPTPGASPSPSPSAAPPVLSPDPIDLVTPEVPGEVVAPIAVARAKSGIAVPVNVPATPGLYRLVATVHGSDSVAFDAATQALIPALIVRVTGPLSAAYRAAGAASAVAGEAFDLPVGVRNLGATAWGLGAVVNPLRRQQSDPAQPAILVGRWIDLDGATGGTPSGAAAADASARLPSGLKPGASAGVVLHLTAPKAPGAYLLLLDVVTPQSGSLAAAGVPPAIVRLVVGVTGAAIGP